MDQQAILLQQLPISKQQLRIAVVTETYPPEVNGVAMTIGRTVAAMQQRDHQIQLVRPKQSAADNPIAQENFEEVLQRGVPIPHYSGLKMGLPAKSLLTRLWTLQRPDIVHIATEGPLGWSALAAANKLRIPVTTDFHTNFHIYSKHYGLAWLRKPIIAYLRKFHNKSLRTLVPTQGILRELAAQGYHNLEVVSRGVDVSLFDPAKRSVELRRQWGIAENAPVVIYVGRLAAEKNLPLLVEAYASLRAHQPHAKLVLVGDGPERAALQASCPDYIFAGMRIEEELAMHYASADMFFFPSMSETFGNVTMEAMASGNAVLAYNYAAAAEYLRHNENGLVAEFDRPRQFIELAGSLANQPDRIAQLGRNARQTAITADWEKVHDKFEQVLIRLTHEHGYADVEAELSLKLD